jgi:hypothetical protein
VIDTSVLVAGVAGFKSLRVVENPSASLLRDWLRMGSSPGLLRRILFRNTEESSRDSVFDGTWWARSSTYSERRRSS